MIRSMTAFARTDSQSEWGVLTWEIRSVNHRYLEPVFRMPDMFRDIEPELREALREFVKRGKLECQLKFQAESKVAELTVDMNLAAELNNALHKINRLLDNPAHINAFDVLNWPGVLVSNEVDAAPLKQQVVQLFKSAMKDLMETRQREGERILPMLTGRLQRIDGIVKQVRAEMPQILTRYHENLRGRIEELQAEVDQQRLEQEIVILASKADVAEELDRLDAHVQEVSRVLGKRETVGRRLDFLMQELNREANTLSSKSVATDSTQFAVELKVLIEQLREQIQNIE